MDDREIREKLDFVVNACISAQRASRRRARRGKATGKKQGVLETSSSTEGPRKAGARALMPASWLSDHVEDYGTTPQASPRSSGRRALAQRDSIGLLEKVIRWLLRP